jgi:predicted SprT family Zn-dependent metalloprotease
MVLQPNFLTPEDLLSMCGLCEFFRAFGVRVLKAPACFISHITPESLKEWLYSCNLSLLLHGKRSVSIDEESQYNLVKMMIYLGYRVSQHMQDVENVPLEDDEDLKQGIEVVRELSDYNLGEEDDSSGSDNVFRDNLQIMLSLLDKLLTSPVVNSFFNEVIKDEIAHLKYEKLELTSRVQKLEEDITQSTQESEQLDLDIDMKEQQVNEYKRSLLRRASLRQGNEDNEDEPNGRQSRTRRTTTRQDTLNSRKDSEARMTKCKEEWREMLKTHDKLQYTINISRKNASVLKERLEYVESELKDLLSKKKSKGTPGSDLGKQVVTLLGWDRFGRAFWLIRFSSKHSGIITEYRLGFHRVDEGSADPEIMDTTDEASPGMS